MKYNIRDIGEKGVIFSRCLDTEQVIALLRPSSVELAEGSAVTELELELTRAEDVVFVRGRIEGHFDISCGRCLAPARVSVEEKELTLTFLPPSTSEDEELELQLEDLDTYKHDGQYIDVASLVREVLLLAIPIMPLCSPACKGICSGCGADLNREPCRCQGDPPTKATWALALSTLKKTNGG